MALNFPSNPSNNQIYIDSTSGNRYRFNAIANVWSYAANNSLQGGSIDTQVIYNDAGAANGHPGLTFRGAANTLTANTINAFSVRVTGNLYVGTNTVIVTNDAVMAQSFFIMDNGSPIAVSTGATTNASFTVANAAYAAVNSAFGVVNAAFSSANNVAPQIAPAFNTANAAFGRANTAFQNGAAIFSGSTRFVSTNAYFEFAGGYYTTFKFGPRSAGDGYSSIEFDPGSGSGSKFDVTTTGGLTVYPNTSTGATATTFDRSGNILNQVSVRSPIFYDSDNTGFYVDPASTSWGVNSAGGAVFRNIQISSSSLTDTVQNVSSGGSLWLQYGHNGPLGLCFGGGTTTAYGQLNITAPSGGWNSRPTVVVASNGDGYLQTRHIRGKDTSGTGVDHLYLQWEQAADVYTGRNIFSLIYYDRNDSAFYVDPNSTSVLNTATISILEVGGVGRSSSHCIGSNLSGAIAWNNSQLEIRNTNGNNVGISFHRAGYTSVALYHDAGSNLRCSGILIGDSDVRAPIFYDLNDTGWYCNPNGTSRLATLQQGVNTWHSSSEGNQRYYFASGDSTYIYGYGYWYLRVGGNGHSGIAENNTRSLFEGAGNIYTIGNIIAYWSDKRLKKNINKITDWRQIINGINGYRFEWNDIGNTLLENSEPGVQVGLIAQEVESVLPQATTIQLTQYKDNVNGKLIPRDDINYDPEDPYKTVKEDKLIPVMIEAIKGLLDITDKQQAQIDELLKRTTK